MSLIGMIQDHAHKKLEVIRIFFVISSCPVSLASFLCMSSYWWLFYTNTVAEHLLRDSNKIFLTPLSQLCHQLSLVTMILNEPTVSRSHYRNSQPKKTEFFYNVRFLSATGKTGRKSDSVKLS